MGLINYYLGFIPQCYMILSPLTDLMSTKKSFVWSEKEENAFRLAKTSLSSAPVLDYPSPSASLRLRTDGSLLGVGGVLEQQCADSKNFRPIWFYSRKLTFSNSKELDRGRDWNVLASQNFVRFYSGRNFSYWLIRLPKFIAHQKNFMLSDSWKF